MRNYRRARSETEKVYREDNILTVAETLLRQSGYDAMTMQKVATSANLAKGTLYLYFGSREELIFSVYERLFDQWIERFGLYQPETTDIDAFIRSFARYYTSDPLFIQLVGPALSLLEQKITHHAYVKSKRAMMRRIKRLAGIACYQLGISPTHSQKLVWRLLTIAAGSTQITLQQRNAITELPSDVQLFLNSTNFEVVFLNAAVSLEAKIIPIN